ncbi:tape measure protein [Clostridium pasteurianum]|uniref:Tape measure domain protein n=1 Tax=Clostridium pasteurianum BC1 TaxID=86416 RepID=R4K4S2_CLOPA|nr:tape measure protein [Clostridium pasteurianum]AGK98162.1 tape measure domain protein [Clostridium pasteurianum BC1]
MEVGQLLVRLGLDKSNFNNGMNSAKSDSQGFVGFLKNTFQFSVGMGMFDAMKEGIKGAWDMSLGFNSQIQQSQIAFEAMTGSAQASKTLIGELSTMAANTPFEFPQLANAARQMEAFGFSTAHIPDDLKKIGDAASGLSLGADGINRITLALGQMSAKGKVTAQDMMQLTDAGVPAWSILAQAMGKSTAEVMKLSEQGLIPADRAIQQLIDGMETRFPNMMDKQSKSFAGLMSTLKDNTQMTLGAVMKPAFDDLTNNILPALIAKMGSVRDAMQTGGMQGVLNELVPPSVASTITNISSLISSLFGFITNNGKQVLVVVSGITGAFVAYKAAVVAVTIVQEANNAITAIMAIRWGIAELALTKMKTATTSATLAQWLLNAAMDANPIMLIVTAVGLLVGALVGYNLLLGQTSSAQDDATQKAIQNINKQKDAQISALDNQTKAQKDAINSKENALSDEHSKTLNSIQEEYNAQVEGLQAQEKALKDAVQKRKQILDDEHNSAIQSIRDYYGVAAETSHSLTDTVKADADKQKQALEDAYNAATKTLDDQTNAQIDSINAQIQAIDDKAKAQKEADQNAKDNQKLSTLEAQLQDAKTVTQKAILQAQIADIEKQINDRKQQDIDTAQKTALQKQIDQIKKAEQDKKDAMQASLTAQKAMIDKDTQAKIDKIQEERKAAEAAENAKYQASKDALDKESSDLDGWSAKQKKVLDQELADKQAAENAKYQAVKAELDAELEAVIETEQKKRQEIEQTAAQQQQAAQTQSSGGGFFSNLWSGISSFSSSVFSPILSPVLSGMYASGTPSASPGLSLVGENGPELLNLNGGESITNAKDTKDIFSNMGPQPNLIQVFLDGNMIHQYYDYSQGRNTKYEARRYGL